MYLVHIYAYPYKYTYIQVLMAQNSCISQPYSRAMELEFHLTEDVDTLTRIHGQIACHAQPEFQQRNFT